jgi:hypothetical protein
VGPRLLADVGIKAEIDKRLAELRMSADECLVRLADMARGSMADLLMVEVVESPDGGEPTERYLPMIDLDRAAKAGKLHLVKAFTEAGQRSGNRVELYDAQAALGKIARAHSLFHDNLNVTDKENLQAWLKE